MAKTLTDETVIQRQIDASARLVDATSKQIDATDYQNYPLASQRCDITDDNIRIVKEATA